MLMTDIVKNSVGKTAVEKTTGNKATVMGVGVNKDQHGREDITVHIAVNGEIETLEFIDFVIKYQIEGGN